MAIDFSPQLNTAAVAIRSGNVRDIVDIFAMLGVAAHNMTEKKATAYAEKMAQNVGRGETANAAKTAETKVMSMIVDKKVETAAKLNTKTLSDADKKGLNDMADTFAQLGVNGEYLSKIRTGDITKNDLEAMATATKGKQDSIASQQTMDNLEVTKLTNALSNAINLITKMLDTLKTNMEKAIGR